MATYSYEIVTKEGKKKKGNVEADSIDKARTALKAEAGMIVSVKEASLLNKDIDINIGKKKASVRDLSVFCRQFNSILKAGVSVIEALDMLSQQTENKKLAAAIMETKTSVEKGETLSNAMRKQGEMFPEMLLNMVAAGEQSGSLEKSLSRMAVHFEKENKLKGLVKKAMMYPVVLIIVAIAVMIVMLVGVLPGFMETFEDMDMDMPAYTLAVMGFSDFLIANWIPIVIVIAGIVIGVKIYAGTPMGKRVFCQLKLKAPIFGKLNTKTACSRFARTMSTLLAAGMSVVEALSITSKVIGNVVYEDTLADTQEKVKGGQPLSRPLRTSGIFPPMIVHMVGIIANATGTTEKICTINLVNAYNGNAFATEPKAGVNTKFQNLLKDYLAQDAVFKTNAGTTTFNVFGAKAAKAGTTLQAKVNTTTGSITVEFTDGTNVIDGKSIKYSVTR